MKDCKIPKLHPERVSDTIVLEAIKHYGLKDAYDLLIDDDATKFPQKEDVIALYNLDQSEYLNKHADQLIINGFKTNIKWILKEILDTYDDNTSEVLELESPKSTAAHTPVIEGRGRVDMNSIPTGIDPKIVEEIKSINVCLTNCNDIYLQNTIKAFTSQFQFKEMVWGRYVFSAMYTWPNMAVSPMYLVVGKIATGYSIDVLSPEDVNEFKEKVIQTIKLKHDGQIEDYKLLSDVDKVINATMKNHIINQFKLINNDEKMLRLSALVANGHGEEFIMVVHRDSKIFAIGREYPEVKLDKQSDKELAKAQVNDPNGLFDFDLATASSTNASDIYNICKIINANTDKYCDYLHCIDKDAKKFKVAFKEQSSPNIFEFGNDKLNIMINTSLNQFHMTICHWLKLAVPIYANAA